MNEKPVIVAFLCNWCSYEGADKAGQARLAVPENMRAIRIPCSSMVDPEYVLEAFTNGASGVLILGCHPGDCHYKIGNYMTLRRIALLKTLIKNLGIEAERLRLDWVSASEGERFAQITKEMAERINNLGCLAQNHHAKSNEK
jgi:F420-non-reducing hydrogenase iron-sulfur subunit